MIQTLSIRLKPPASCAKVCQGTKGFVSERRSAGSRGMQATAAIDA